MPNSYTMQAQEINTQLQFIFTDSNTGQPISLTGGVMTLYALAPQLTRATPVKVSYPLTIAADGLSASYFTKGMEFNQLGNYTLQAILVQNGSTHHGPQIRLNILPNI